MELWRKEFELFKLAEDLSGQRDLSEEMPEKAAKLDEKLMNWLNQVNASLPKQNPQYFSAD